MLQLKIHTFPRCMGAVLMSVAILCAVPGHAEPSQAQAVVVQPAEGPDLDLSVHYYTRVLTAEGVLRESRYEEKMIRRAGHVWTHRVLPANLPGHEALHRHGKQAGTNAVQKEEYGHRHFSHVLLPRHVFYTDRGMRLEFVDFYEREVIAITPSEYENVNFDGSWANAFFLADPKILSSMPIMHRATPVAGAQWRELAKGGIVQRVLWDERRKIPLLVERAASDGRHVERVKIRVQPSLAKSLPWEGIKGYAQKEYADFLD